MAAEDARPNAERLREYGEAGRSSLEQQLYSAAPIYQVLEIVKLGDSLALLMEMLGADNDMVRKILAGKSPRERAAELIQGSSVNKVEERKRIAAGGNALIENSKDTMLQLARMVDPRSRELRTRFEQEVEEPQRQAYAKIAAARFKLLGSDTYPDATFTLRLAFGAVKGYTEEGKKLPPWTTMGGTFEHAKQHGDKEPFELPESWLKHKSDIKPSTPFNFVSTADIIGGNSGSPVINQKGELVGIIFDGNLQSLVLDFVYTDEQARAISVHSAAIMEAREKVYSASRVVDELKKK
jgi:hypothetical protein